jgi:hypothetical protein
MLLGNIAIEKLEGVSVGMWNGPLDEEKPSYLFVDVVGAFEEYHVPTETKKHDPKKGRRGPSASLLPKETRPKKGRGTLSSFVFVS